MEVYIYTAALKESKPLLGNGFRERSLKTDRFFHHNSYFVSFLLNYAQTQTLESVYNCSFINFTLVFFSQILKSVKTTSLKNRWSPASIKPLTTPTTNWWPWLFRTTPPPSSSPASASRPPSGSRRTADRSWRPSTRPPSWRPPPWRARCGTTTPTGTWRSWARSRTVLVGCTFFLLFGTTLLNPCVKLGTPYLFFFFNLLFIITRFWSLAWNLGRLTFSLFFFFL